jgi:hypothetical protein
MIIGELTLLQAAGPFTNTAPFTYKSLPASYQAANYWVNLFGAADESVTITKNITSFIQGSAIHYSNVLSLLDCIDIETSFFWDSINEILYDHVSHNANQFTDTYEYGNSFGFTDTGAIYIDNLFYEPLIKSIPNIAQQQDIINYKQLSFLSGSIEMDNTEGKLDFLIDLNIMGNDYRLYFLETEAGIQNYNRTEFVSLAAFFLEDYTIGLSTTIFDLQDIRKKQNVKILTELFTVAEYSDLNEKYIDKPIPLLYGQVRVSEAIPVDGDAGSGTVEFRQAIILTSIGTVQVEIDDLWTTKATASVDLSTGSFTLSEANGRQANGTPYKCRVIDSVGIDITYASDVIKELNQRYLLIEFRDSTYNITEWETEEIALTEIGIVFNKSVTLFNAIKDIQNGANIGFRYEIMADGRRTIRIDDWDRTESNYVSNSQILDINNMEVETDHELLAAFLEVQYSRDYQLKNNLSIINSDYSTITRQNNKQEPTIIMETALVTLSDASDRAELYAERFHIIHGIVNLELLGPEWYTLRIYDIIEIEITSGFVDAGSAQVTGREFYGTWKAQVTKIDPDFVRQSNKISAILIEQIEPVQTVLITKTNSIYSLGVDDTTTLKWRVK